MNERIAELALQASEYVNSVYTPPVRSKTPGKIWEDGHIGWHTQFNEKFAELIVQECITACEQHDMESFGILPVRAVLVTKSCQNNIKEHFGVAS
jgi:hypothetical protein